MATEITYHYATVADLAADLERQADLYQKNAEAEGQPRWKVMEWLGYVNGLRSAASQIREAHIGEEGK